MRCRGVMPELYTVEGRCVWWAKQLKKESTSDPANAAIKSYLEPDTDLANCKELLEEFEQDCTLELDESYHEVVSVRLSFLIIRLRRINPTSDSQSTLKESLIKTGETLQKRLELEQYKRWKETLRSRREDSFVCRSDQLNPELEGPVTDERDPTTSEKDVSQKPVELQYKDELRREPSLPMQQAKVSMENYSDLDFGRVLLPNERLSVSRSPPALYKWGLKFTGDNEDSASCFLQRVVDYARSRQVSESDLLNSISDLLEGSALRWYRRKRETFTNYQDFVKRFLHEFEPLLQSDHLKEFLKSRKQKPSESIVQYISFMEDQFLRLPRIPPERERVKIIRNNLLPTFIRALALSDFDSVDDLEDACKRIEASNTQARNNSFEGPRPQQRNAYVPAKAQYPSQGFNSVRYAQYSPTVAASSNPERHNATRVPFSDRGPVRFGLPRRGDYQSSQYQKQREGLHPRPRIAPANASWRQGWTRKPILDSPQKDSSSAVLSCLRNESLYLPGSQTRKAPSPCDKTEEAIEALRNFSVCTEDGALTHDHSSHSGPKGSLPCESRVLQKTTSSVNRCSECQENCTGAVRKWTSAAPKTTGPLNPSS